MKPIFHLFKIHFYCAAPLPSATLSSECQASSTVISAWDSLIGSRALAQPTSAAGFGDNKSGVGGFSVASRQGAFLSPFSQETGRQQGGLGQLRCAEVVGKRKPNRLLLPPAIRLHAGLRLAKKQAGPRHTGTANALLPPPSSNFSRKPQKYQIWKQGHKRGSDCFPEVRGSYPSPKRISELPEFTVALWSPNTHWKHFCRHVYSHQVGCWDPNAGFLQVPAVLTAPCRPLLKTPGETETVDVR